MQAEEELKVIDESKRIYKESVTNKKYLVLN